MFYPNDIPFHNEGEWFFQDIKANEELIEIICDKGALNYAIRVCHKLPPRRKPQAKAAPVSKAGSTHETIEISSDAWPTNKDKKWVNLNSELIKD